MSNISEEAHMALEYYIDAKGFDESLIGGYFPLVAADPVMADLIAQRQQMMSASELLIRNRLEVLRDGGPL